MVLSVSLMGHMYDLEDTTNIEEAELFKHFFRVLTVVVRASALLNFRSSLSVFVRFRIVASESVCRYDLRSSAAQQDRGMVLYTSSANRADSYRSGGRARAAIASGRSKG